MATAAVQVPSSNRLEPGSCSLKAATFPKTEPVAGINATTVVDGWVSAFNKALTEPNGSAIGQLFLKESYWRDQLALSWDYHTLKGPESITSFLSSGPIRIRSLEVDQSNALRQPNISGFDPQGQVNGVVSFLTVETDVGSGRGLVRLLQDVEDGRKWKSFTLFTAMHQLEGHQETIRANRPKGVDHGEQVGRENWQQKRKAMENFDDGLEPTVLILGNQEHDLMMETQSAHIRCIGAGQGGLASAASLQQLKIPTLIIDRNPRVGDNWRNRYVMWNS